MRLLVLTGFAAAALACTGCATGQTGFADFASDDSASLVGNVVSNQAGEVDYWVEYGTSTAYGSRTATETIDVAQGAPTGVRVVVDGLQRSTRYHFRVCAEDASQQGGPGCGQDRAFTTQSFACGETVTTNVRLTNDYLCNNEPGLVIGAAGLDINLAGHRLNSGTQGLPNGPIGVDNRGGFDDVTVRNGTFVGFGDAVYAQDASRNRVLDIGGTTLISGVTFRQGDHNEVRHVDLNGDNWGVLATDSDNLVIADSEFGGEGSEGILVVRGDFARILRNRVARTIGPIPFTSGIQLVESANGRIEDNQVSGPWSFGGIWVEGSLHVVLDNVVTGGKRVPGDSAQSSGDGIHVFRGDAGILLRGNFTTDNEGDGIDVRVGGTKLGDNHALSNGGYGIFAPPGTVDLGGNLAAGNRGPAQCVNIPCL